MEAITPRFTHPDLREMPENGRRYEVIEGELCVSPPPKTRHQRILTRFLVSLFAVQEAGMGVALPAPVDIHLDDQNCVQPDVVFVRSEHADIIGEDDIRGVPDLVVEVLSRSTRARDLGAKLRLYARFGVRVYWVVDPDAETVTVFDRQAEGYIQSAVLRAADTLCSEPLPGFELGVEGLFR